MEAIVSKNFAHMIVSRELLEAACVLNKVPSRVFLALLAAGFEGSVENPKKIRRKKLKILCELERTSLERGLRDLLDKGILTEAQDDRYYWSIPEDYFYSEDEETEGE